MPIIITEKAESQSHPKAQASVPNRDETEIRTIPDRIDIYDIDTVSQLDPTLTPNLTDRRKRRKQKISNGSTVNKAQSAVNNSNDSQNGSTSVPTEITLSQVNRAVDSALNQQSPRMDKQKCNEEAESWTTVVRKSKQRSSSGRPAPLRGSNDNEGTLKTAQKMAFLFLSGLAPEVTQVEVLDYLKCNGVGDGCRCEKMQTKKDKHKASFRLTVPQSTLNQYLCSTLWPKDVIINHFMNIQRH